MMTDLKPHEREQLQFLSDVMVKDLSGHAYVFDILNLWKFDAPRKLTTGSLIYRGCVGAVPEGFHAMLLQRLPVDPSLPWAPQGGILNAFFRMPAAHARLCAEGRWPSMLLPDYSLCDGGRASSSTKISWHRLQCKTCELPQPMPSHIDHDYGRLDAALATDAAQHLRKLAKGLVEQLNDDLQLEQYMSLEKCVTVLHRYSEEMRGASRLNSVFVGGRFHELLENNLRLRGKLYRVGYLFHVMLLANLVSSSWNLREVVARAVKVALPDVLQEPIAKLLDELQDFITPSGASVSRWRLLIDAAYMVWQRRQHAASPKYARCLLTDASSQHGREFQNTWIMSILWDELGKLFRLSNALIKLWRLSLLVLQTIPEFRGTS